LYESRRHFLLGPGEHAVERSEVELFFYEKMLQEHTADHPCCSIIKEEKSEGILKKTTAHGIGI
jgi:hypothetical protein